MCRWFICLIYVSFFCAASFAQDLSTPRSTPKRYSSSPKKSDAFDIKRFHVNAGLHTEFYNQVQVDAKGNLKQFETLPTIGFGFMAPFNSELSLMPEINWVLPQKADDKIMKNLLMFRADLGYQPVDWFRLRFGTSIMWMNQYGSGGSVKENNGNSTSTFYYPSEGRSSFNNTLDLGAEFLLEDWALRLQTYTYSVFREERRQLSYTLFISYYWDR